MPGTHFFIERNAAGTFVAKVEGEGEPKESFGTQEEAVAHAKMLNPKDHPDVERVRNTESGSRDQWRAAR